MAVHGHYPPPLSTHACMRLPTRSPSSVSNLIIQCGPRLSHHAHKQQPKQITGKQHYLWAHPSRGARQLQTLHVTTPCHTHMSKHT